MTTRDELKPEFFEAMYRRDADPWQFAASAYELGRYEATVRALAHTRYRRAFEPGCSIGVLTAKLAALCDAVEAIDFSETAISRARERCAGLPHVELRCVGLPERMPVEGFDLLVLSEIGYYFPLPTWGGLVEQMVSGMPEGGTLLAVHWLGESQDHETAGDAVHEAIGAQARLHLDYTERTAGYRLDRWTRG